MKQNKKAEPLYLQSLDIRYANLQTNFATMSESEKEKYLATNARAFNDFYDFAYLYNPQTNNEQAPSPKEKAQNSKETTNNEQQATTNEQAPSPKEKAQNSKETTNNEQQATTNEQQATTNEHLTSNIKHQTFITGEAYNLSLTTKGLLLAGNIQIQNAIMQSGDTMLISKYNTWKETKELCGKLSQMSKGKIKKMGYDLDSIENAANIIEKQLSQKSNVFAAERKLLQYTWQEVQKNLGKNEVAIEFITYKAESVVDALETSGTSTLREHQGADTADCRLLTVDSTWYCALVLKPDGKPPTMLHLCTKEQLEYIINTRPVYNSNVYDLVWKPLVKTSHGTSLLEGVENVYVSLTGLLNRVSFAMLTDVETSHVASLPDTSYLCAKYNLYILNNTRELATGKMKVVTSKTKLTGKPQTATAPATATTAPTAAIFGGAMFDFNADLAMMQKSNDAKRNENIKLSTSRASVSGTSEGTWNYLPGTLFEANAIAQLFEDNKWSTTEFTGYRANEENIKTLVSDKSPTLLHISTHGYFVSAPDTTVYNHSKNPFKLTNNSLMRSGLILAGGNRAWQGYPQIEGTEDGVLTSYEVSNMYLPNTELVVLSACETGLGDIKGGEGVYGLQRAFQVAGAKAVIMSLWQVPDDETMMLMSSFYTKWFATGDIHQSFREAQLEMSKKYEPFYWAAFVLIE